MRVAEAKRVDVRVNPDRVFQCRLTGRQIGYLLEMLQRSTIPGSMAALHVQTAEALEDPILHATHIGEES